MAAQPFEMPDALDAMSLQEDQIDKVDKLTLDDNLQNKLTEIEKNYESIFSWNIYGLVGKPQSMLVTLIDKIQEKCDYEMPEEENKFDIHKFYLKLILSFELYNDKKYEEALLAIKYVVSHMTLCTEDRTYKQYSNAFNHIALSTYAYIALSINLDSEKIIENIKPTVELNQREKSAICAVKAYGFMQYAPVGNDIALDLADQARTLDPTKPEWIVIWLIAKARVRHYQEVLSFPDDSEISAAEMLMSNQNQNSEFYLQASRIYSDIARFYLKKGNKNQTAKYYTLAANIQEKAMLLEKVDMKQLGYIFMDYIHLPIQYCSSSLADEVVQKLQNVNYYYVIYTLGKYYLKCKKDYQKAQIYFSRSMIAGGTFQSTMDVFKIECFLQSTEQFQFVETLNMIYDRFLNPKRRCIILTQIIIYYYREDNPKEIMHYLKLFMDQDVDESWKKEHLRWVYPFKQHGERPQSFSCKQFTTYITDIMNIHEWSLEEKITVIETFNRFNKMVGDDDNTVCSKYTKKTNENFNVNDRTFIGKTENRRVDKQFNGCEKLDKHLSHHQTMYQHNYSGTSNEKQHPFQHSSRVYNNSLNDGRSGELSWRNQKGRIVFNDKSK